MKILHVADLHNSLSWLDWVSANAHAFDLVVVAGDLQDAFSPVELRTQAMTLSAWVAAIPAPTIVCSGNHDFWVRFPGTRLDVYADAAWVRLLRGRGSVVAVDGDFIEFNGLRIFVNGWLNVPQFEIPADLVVAHAPPTGSPCAVGAQGDVGDEEFWDGVRWAPPALLLCGHVHNPRSIWCRWTPVDEHTLVLVPGRDERLKIPPHWIIDTTSLVATHSSGVRVGFHLDSPKP